MKIKFGVHTLERVYSSHKGNACSNCTVETDKNVRHFSSAIFETIFEQPFVSTVQLHCLYSCFHCHMLEPLFGDPNDEIFACS